MMRENISDLKITKNLKYLALYTKLGFFENQTNNSYEQIIDNIQLKIDLTTNEFSVNQTIVLNLNTSHDAFVLLELIVTLLKNKISWNDLKVDATNFSCEFQGYSIVCKAWDSQILNQEFYSSRLNSGMIERKFHLPKLIADFFYEHHLAFKSDFNLDNDDFLIENGILKKIKNVNPVMIIPEGTVALDSGLLWDNQVITEIKLPDSLISLGGDTFYNCSNLKHANIPVNTIMMGNNPFAGCFLLELENHSPAFIYENGLLFNQDKTEIIYANIATIGPKLIIPNGVLIIGKHAFYQCKNLKCLCLPQSLLKMENNPFSGCDNLVKIKNNSSAFYIYKKKIIYDAKKEVIISVLCNIKKKKLQLLRTTKTIARNAFWNCQNIHKLIIPASVIEIGYNPFVGCQNIEFIVQSDNQHYLSQDGVLYTKNKSKLIAYPIKKAVGNIILDEHVIELERGAFSGCHLLKSIDLKNVNLISKTCFSNCHSLKHVYLSDLVYYVGEWAFSNCEHLKSINVHEDTYLDKNLILNSCHAEIQKRNEYDNYLFESDNLYTLSSMSKNYQNKIDAILIDPPYNSNISYLEYCDHFNEQYFEFIDQRMELSYSLLSDNGFHCIHIDQDNLETIVNVCKQYFEPDNIEIHQWEKIHEYFDQNKTLRVAHKPQVLYECIVICKKNSNAQLNHIKQPYFDNQQLLEKDAEVPAIFSLFGTNASAKDEIADDFGDRFYFSTPKPIKLIKELIRATTHDNSIVLDYFAGSGTTGIACMQLNHEDGLHRNFILITNNESQICEKVTTKRVSKYAKIYETKFVKL